MNVLLDVQELNVTIHLEDRKVRPVTDVSFSLARNETLGIVGESGSGKSVLVRTVMGLIAPSNVVSRSGTIDFDGTDIAAMPVSQVQEYWGGRIGMVLQDPLRSLNPVRKIGTQLTETIRRHHPRLSKKEAKEEAISLMKSVGIGDAARRLSMYPHQFSGGMRQRVMIAIAVAGEADLLIADEPTTALDVSVQNQILNLMGEYRRKRGMSMILVTHDLAVAAGRTDRIAVMYAGEVVESARTADLFSNVRMPYTQALLNAAPPLSAPSGSKVDAIPGQPPDLSAMINGCRFASRCPFAQDQCFAEHPPFTTDANGHQYRCWFPLGAYRASTDTTESAGASRG